jgi:hypothetical protein
MVPNPCPAPEDRLNYHPGGSSRPGLPPFDFNMVHFIPIGKLLEDHHCPANPAAGRVDKSAQRGQKTTGEIYFSPSSSGQNINKVHQNRLARSGHNRIFKPSLPIFSEPAFHLLKRRFVGKTSNNNIK